MRLRILTAAVLALALNFTGCALKTDKLADGVAVASAGAPGPNSGIVTTSFGTVVIDGQPSVTAGESLIEAAQKFTGYKDVTYLVLTSHHADHTASNEGFLKAEIVSTAASRAALLEKAAAERKLLSERLGIPVREDAAIIPATLAFEKQLVLHAGWPKKKIVEVRMIELGAGAAPGNLVVLLPKTQVLFAGDLVNNRTFPYMGDADLAGWLAALEAIDKLDFKVLVPGHGAPGGKELVAAMRKFLLDLAGAVSAAKNSGMKLEAAKKGIKLPAGYEKWDAAQELLPVAVERLWNQKLPAPPVPAPTPAPTPTPTPAPAPATP